MPRARKTLRITSIVTAIVLAAVAAAGWYYSNQILGPDLPPARTGERILALTDSTITLAPSGRTRRPGYWALEWDGGHAALGDVIEQRDDRIVRGFRLVSGTPPDSVARAAGFAMDADPRGWLRLDFESVSIPARIGPLPAWQIPGTDSTWAVFVHGRGATRAEVLRMLPAYVGLGLPCLVTSYRGDPGAPLAPGGGYRMGWTEWLDLEDAIRYALGQGARDVVLVGCSMGGGIVTQLLRHSSLRDRVRAAVLDAPALDWNAVLARAAVKRQVPAALTETGKFVTTLRTGIRWNDLTQVRHAAEFSTPMLILHGESDNTVPIVVAERFAAARTDLVTLEKFPEADHVESSNFDGARYERVVSEWLTSARVRSLEPAPTPVIPMKP